MVTLICLIMLHAGCCCNIPDLSSCISQNNRIVQFGILDLGGLAGIVIFLVILIVVSVVMVVLVVFGVYKYRTRSHKSSVDSEYDLTTEMVHDVIDNIWHQPSPSLVLFSTYGLCSWGISLLLYTKQ